MFTNALEQRHQQSTKACQPTVRERTASSLGDRIMATLSKARAESLLGFGVAMAATLAFAIYAHADPVRVTNLGQYGSLNLRMAPSLHADVIGRLPTGANGIEWTGNQSRRGSTLWYELIYNGKIGWASSRYLELVPPRHQAVAIQLTRAPHHPRPETNRISIGGNTQQLSNDDVGAAIFGLIAGGILWSIFSDSVDAQPDPQPAPPPPPTPRRRQLSCATDDVSFRYERATGEVELTIGRRTIRGQAEEQIEANRRSFALPFSSHRGEGILIVDDIRADGNNANLYWDGARRNAFYNLACQRVRQG